jgi:colanic acid biosynthesis glycosyl transferase WcaI
VYQGYHNSLLTREDLQGVKILRVWSYISPSKGIWSRLLSYASFSAAAFYGGLAAGRPDLVFSYSPPLPLGISAWLLSRIWNIPWVLRVEDLYPQAAVASGILRNRAVIRFFESLAQFLYRKATHISLISLAFRESLSALGIPDVKLSIAPVWADPEQILPQRKENSFRREHGLVEKFVILYAGNLGLTSALEDVLLAAEVLRSNPAFRFVFVGEGVKKKELQARAAHLHLENVIFLPYQPRRRYSEMLAAADAGLVTLNKNSAGSSLPNKVFNIMASGRPVLSIAPPQCDLAQLIRHYSCGINVAPGDWQALVEAIQELRADGLKAECYGRNGRNALVENFSRSRVLQIYENLILSTKSYGNTPTGPGNL